MPTLLGTLHAAGARPDRDAAPVRDVRPLGHRRALDEPPSRHRRPTIFIYDGHPGGVGITERGFEQFEGWVADTARMLADCPCADGCPSCVQSPKCGNLNDMLDKAGARLLLDRLRLGAGGGEATGSFAKEPTGGHRSERGESLLKA